MNETHIPFFVIGALYLTGAVLLSRMNSLVSKDRQSSWPWKALNVPFMPAFVILLFLVSLGSIPLALRMKAKQRRFEKTLRTRLAECGRSIEWTEVEKALQRGEGTLIIEHVSMKGPVREWWTEDNILAQTTLSLPKGNLEPVREEDLGAIRAFAENCAKSYVDVERGTANITTVPVPPERMNDSRMGVVIKLTPTQFTGIFLPTRRKLKQRFPSARILTLIRWQSPPFIGWGDAENFFLNSDEPKFPGDAAYEPHSQSRRRELDFGDAASDN